MKKLFLLSGIILVLALNGPFAQDCHIYFPQEKGKVREMTSYDQKDKKTGMVRQEVLDFQSKGPDADIRINTVSYDADGAVILDTDLIISCRDGVFKIDMSEYVTEILSAYQEMDVQIESDEITFPKSMKPGDILPDGNMNIKMVSEGITVMNMDITISSRKVEAIENITTPAGTFECYKINYIINSKTRLINIQTSATEWISEDVGVVRTENFNKKGKLTGYSLLTAFN